MRGFTGILFVFFSSHVYMVKQSCLCGLKQCKCSLNGCAVVTDSCKNLVVRVMT